MLVKVISGGQTGADQGGLSAAKESGLKTGGWAPKDFKTSKGNMYSLKKNYGLVDSEKNYKERTGLNVKDSDGTIRFAHNFNSPGEICTLNYIKKYKKPYLDIDLSEKVKISPIVNWLIYNNIKILNIAGNTETSDNNIFQRVKRILLKVFKKLKEIG